MNNRRIFIAILLMLSLSLVACTPRGQVKFDENKYNIVTTTTLVGDLVENIGGDRVNVITLMGPGVDPHIYKASAGDVTRMQEADMVVYSGLHLEGKMGDIFEKIEEVDKLIISVGDDIDRYRLLDFVTNPGNYDPHIWFDVSLWKEAAKKTAEGLKTLDKENSSEYEENLANYLEELDDLEDYIISRRDELPEDKRILVTAHDAFSYFGRAYGFQVKGLQGISTSAEAGTSNVRELADFIVENEVKAIFIESSVPKKSIEALQEAVRSRGFNVDIGGELYSDSTGDGGTPEATYIGTFKANIDTIVDGLK